VTSAAAEDRLGPYRLLHELGRGGMGLLFEAMHERLERKVALKLLAPELVADEDFRERFVRESQLLAAIEHPNIIPIYDAGEADGLLYLAMRLVEGYDLGTLIEREGALEPRHAVGILEQVASALDAAHARDLVHRDVKPSNILIDDASGRVFLADFGVARRGQADAGAKSDLMVGTVDYAAPEQLRGDPVGPSADVYALGCVLFESLTASRAYERDTDVAVIYAHALEPPPRPSELRAGLPRAIDGVIATAMAKAPTERYASCAALTAEARTALGETKRPLPRAGVPAASARVLGEPAAGFLEWRVPTPATPLVGREREVEQLADFLRGNLRLLTLTGPGGTGKTRLAIEVASVVRDAYPGGAAFVDLTPVSEPGLFLPALSEALGVDERAGDATQSDAALLPTVCARLKGPPTLLVLDSFEHLLAVAPLVGDLLAGAPGLTVLVTSHAPLHLSHEHEYPLSPLPLPENEDVDVDTAARSAAVALFVERARAVVPDFALDTNNVGYVTLICKRLDGLPLAIELAAARLRLLSPQALVERLANSLELLTGGARDAPARHQTLRAAIDWSYQLLDPGERALFERLGVFTGGFTLDAAESVCGVDARPGETLAGVESLLEKSLLRHQEDIGGEPRFALMQAIQEYALYRLIERKELPDRRRLHAAYYLRLAEEAEPELFGAEQATWVRRLEADAGNLRAALAWALDSENVEQGMRAAAALSRFWSVRGRMSEGRVWLRQALDRTSEVAPLVRARALFADGYAALGQGELRDATERFEESLALARAAGDERAVATSLAQLGWVLAARGESQRAVALSEECLTLARKLDDRRTASVALANLAETAAGEGALDRAAELLDECLALRRQEGDRRNVANALLNLGRIELARGRQDRATILLDEGLELAGDVGDTWGLSMGLSSLGHLELLRREPARAAERLSESLKLASTRRDRRLAAECFGGLAAVAALEGNAGRAARLAGAAEQARVRAGAVPSALERVLEEHEALAPGSPPSEALEAERVRGRALSFQEAVTYALQHGAPADPADD
jgi:predicted ATPase